MPRIRLTIRHNPNDPAEDLRYAARLRVDLWAHSPVEIDPDNRAHRTHRDASRNAYFEFATEMPSEVERVVLEYGHSARVSVSVTEEEAGEECLKCGSIARPVLPTVCPTCLHRDIDPCPHPQCRAEVPRQEYQNISGDLFQCPRCGGRVRLQINPDLWNADRTLNEPFVVVENAVA